MATKKPLILSLWSLAPFKWQGELRGQGTKTEWDHMGLGAASGTDRLWGLGEATQLLLAAVSSSVS